jgi:hypothetical protein
MLKNTREKEGSHIFEGIKPRTLGYFVWAAEIYIQLGVC